MREPVLQKEMVGTNRSDRLRGEARRGRGKKIAISFAGTWLGDRLILEAPLRLHRRNRPNDYLIAILDRGDEVDFPYCVRRHFKEIWWLRGGQKWNGQAWVGSKWAAAGRRVRDALVEHRVTEVYTAWAPGQFPGSSRYAIRPHNCFIESNYLRRWRFYPRVVVPRREKQWATDYLASRMNAQYDALVSVHVRNIPRFGEKNLDPALAKQMIEWLRARGRFAFLLVGRDDDTPNIGGSDIFSFVGERWPFDRTAAIIAETSLFLGVDSSLTHAAAGLGVPLVAVGYTADLAHPFTSTHRYVLFHKGARPETVFGEMMLFLQRIGLVSAGRKNNG